MIGPVYKSFISFVLLALFFGLVSCGSSDGDVGGTQSRNFSGIAIDGILSGAEVFLDQNGNGTYDAGTEFPLSVPTDNSGKFSFNFTGNGVITVFGGIDATTNMPFRGIVQLNPNLTRSKSVVISPVSGFIHHVGVSTASAILSNLTGLTLEQIQTQNYLTTTNLPSTAKRTLVDFSIRYQKIVETLTQAVSLHSSSTKNIRVFSSSASNLLALNIAQSTNRSSVDALFNQLNTSSILQSLGIESTERRNILSEKISSLNETVQFVVDSSADTNALLLTGELLTETIVQDVFTTNTQILENAVQIARTRTLADSTSSTLTDSTSSTLTDSTSSTLTDSTSRTLADYDVIQLASVLNDSSQTANITTLMDQALPSTLPTTIKNTRLTLINIPTNDTNTSTDVATIYFRSDNRVTICVNERLIMKSGTWRRADNAMILSKWPINYAISMTRPPDTQTTFQYIAGTNIPINGDKRLLRIGVQKKHAFTTDSTEAPTVGAHCPRISNNS